MEFETLILNDGLKPYSKFSKNLISLKLYLGINCLRNLKIKLIASSYSKLYSLYENLIQ